MDKINFIGAMDKTDVVIYTAKALIGAGKKVIVVDATMTQKAKYIVPTIESKPAYVTNFAGIDIATGFNNYTEIKRYLNMPDTAALTYDYALLDIDDENLIDSFEIKDAYKNFLLTSFDIYSLKKGLEIIKMLPMNTEISRVYFSNQMSQEEERYFEFLVQDMGIRWKEEIIYFPFGSEDRDIIMANQRANKIKIKGLSAGYKEALQTLAQSICEDTNALKKSFRQMERGV